MLFRNSFGANFANPKTNQELKNGVIFLEDGDPQLFLLYPVGRHIGVRDVRENATPQGGSGAQGSGSGGNGSSGGSGGHHHRSGMKFIKQPEQVREITSLTLSPVNKRFLAVCERHRGDPNTYISLYDIKTLFKQQAFKERIRINVGDLYPPGMFAAAQQKDLTALQHPQHGGGGTFSPH